MASRPEANDARRVAHIACRASAETSNEPPNCRTEAVTFLDAALAQH